LFKVALRAFYFWKKKLCIQPTCIIGGTIVAGVCPTVVRQW
jgi:hypothetical protein